MTALFCSSTFSPTIHKIIICANLAKIFVPRHVHTCVGTKRFVKQTHYTVHSPRPAGRPVEPAGPPGLGEEPDLLAVLAPPQPARPRPLQTLQPQREQYVKLGVVWVVHGQSDRPREQQPPTLCSLHRRARALSRAWPAWLRTRPLSPAQQRTCHDRGTMTSRHALGRRHS